MIIRSSSLFGLDQHMMAYFILAIALILIPVSNSAPMYESDQTELENYGESTGCYYNYNHYGEGDRIMTNEPCLNCTCHDRMLMCYLRVCPFTKAIGQDCTIEKREDQCCPVITCPEVEVQLVDHQTTANPSNALGATSSSEVGSLDQYGCSINGRFYPEGAQVPSNPQKPCELCYCIRNMTTCVMQECTLHIDGCQPIYNKGVCCPVKYDCDHEKDSTLMLEDESTTTVRPTPGFILTTTVSPSVSTDCVHNGETYADGALIMTDKPCEHCYCMRGDIVCAVQECGTPLENEGKNCTALPPAAGQCCPDKYICDGSAATMTTTATVPTATPSADDIEPEQEEQEVKADEAARPAKDEQESDSAVTTAQVSVESTTLPQKVQPTVAADKEQLDSDDDEQDQEHVAPQFEDADDSQEESDDDVQAPAKEEDAPLVTTEQPSDIREPDAASDHIPGHVGPHEDEEDKPVDATTQADLEEPRTTVRPAVQSATVPVEQDEPTTVAHADDEKPDAAGTTVAPAKDAQEPEADQAQSEEEDDKEVVTTKPTFDEVASPAEVTTAANDEMVEQAFTTAVPAEPAVPLVNADEKENEIDDQHHEDDASHDDTQGSEVPEDGQKEEDEQKEDGEQKEEDEKKEEDEQKEEDERAKPAVTEQQEAATTPVVPVRDELISEPEQNTYVPSEQATVPEQDQRPEVSTDKKEAAQKADDAPQVPAEQDFVELPPAVVVTELPPIPTTSDEGFSTEQTPEPPKDEILPNMPLEADSHVLSDTMTTEHAPTFGDRKEDDGQEHVPFRGQSGADLDEPVEMNTIIPLDTEVQKPDEQDEQDEQAHQQINDVAQDSSEEADEEQHSEKEPEVMTPVHGDTKPEETPVDEKTDDEQVTGSETPDQLFPESIPGEGDCLIDGVTYENGANVPSSGKCQVACHCSNSIVHCEMVRCEAAPNADCVPKNPLPGECCPTYSCAKEPATTVSSASVESTEVSTESDADSEEEQVSADVSGSDSDDSTKESSETSTKLPANDSQSLSTTEEDDDESSKPSEAESDSAGFDLDDDIFKTVRPQEASHDEQHIDYFAGNRPTTANYDDDIILSTAATTHAPVAGSSQHDDVTQDSAEVEQPGQDTVAEATPSSVSASAADEEGTTVSAVERGPEADESADAEQDGQAKPTTAKAVTEETGTTQVPFTKADDAEGSVAEDENVKPDEAASAVEADEEDKRVTTVAADEVEDDSQEVQVTTASTVNVEKDQEVSKIDDNVTTSSSVADDDSALSEQDEKQEDTVPTTVRSVEPVPVAPVAVDQDQPSLDGDDDETASTTVRADKPFPVADDSEDDSVQEVTTARATEADAEQEETATEIDTKRKAIQTTVAPATVAEQEDDREKPASTTQAAVTANDLQDEENDEEKLTDEAESSEDEVPGSVAATTARPFVEEEPTTQRIGEPEATQKPIAGQDEEQAGTTVASVVKEQDDEQAGTTVASVVKEQDDEQAGTTVAPIVKEQDEEQASTTVAPVVKEQDEEPAAGTTVVPVVKERDEEQAGTTVAPVVKEQESDEPASVTVQVTMEQDEEDVQKTIKATVAQTTALPNAQDDAIIFPVEDDEDNTPIVKPTLEDKISTQDAVKPTYQEEKPLEDTVKPQPVDEQETDDDNLISPVGGAEQDGGFHFPQEDDEDAEEPIFKPTLDDNEQQHVAVPLPAEIPQETVPLEPVDLIKEDDEQSTTVRVEQVTVPLSTVAPQQQDREKVTPAQDDEQEDNEIEADVKPISVPEKKPEQVPMYDEIEETEQQTVVPTRAVPEATTIAHDQGSELQPTTEGAEKDALQPVAQDKPEADYEPEQPATVTQASPVETTPSVEQDVEKEQDEKEQDEKEQDVKEQDEKEQDVKEQDVKEQDVKEQDETEQDEKEQGEKEQDETEQDTPEVPSDDVQATTARISGADSAEKEEHDELFTTPVAVKVGQEQEQLQTTPSTPASDADAEKEEDNDQEQQVYKDDDEDEAQVATTPQTFVKPVSHDENQLPGEDAESDVPSVSEDSTTQAAVSDEKEPSADADSDADVEDDDSKTPSPVLKEQQTTLAPVHDEKDEESEKPVVSDDETAPSTSDEDSEQEEAEQQTAKPPKIPVAQAADDASEESDESLYPTEPVPVTNVASVTEAGVKDSFEDEQTESDAKVQLAQTTLAPQTAQDEKIQPPQESDTVSTSTEQEAPLEDDVDFEQEQEKRTTASPVYAQEQDKKTTLPAALDSEDADSEADNDEEATSEKAPATTAKVPSTEFDEKPQETPEADSSEPAHDADDEVAQSTTVATPERTGLDDDTKPVEKDTIETITTAQPPNVVYDEATKPEVDSQHKDVELPATTVAPFGKDESQDDKSQDDKSQDDKSQDDKSQDDKSQDDKDDKTTTSAPVSVTEADSQPAVTAAAAPEEPERDTSEEDSAADTQDQEQTSEASTSVPNVPERDDNVQQTVSTSEVPVAFDATSDEEHEDAEQPQTDDLNADDDSSEEAEEPSAVPTTTTKAQEKVSTTVQPSSTTEKEEVAEDFTPKPEVYTTVAAESDSLVTEQPTTVQQESVQPSTEVPVAHKNATTTTAPSQDELQTTGTPGVTRDEEQQTTEGSKVSQEPVTSSSTSTTATTSQSTAAVTEGPVREASQPTTTQDDLAQTTVAPVPVAAQDDKLDDKLDEKLDDKVDEKLDDKVAESAVPEKPQPVSDDSEEQQEAVKPTFTEDENDDQQKVQEPEVVSEDSSSPAKPTQQPETVGPSYGAPGQHYDSGYGHMPPHYPPSSYEDDYGEEEDPAAFGPGTCRYGGKLYVSAQQIPRDDPCDFCFCFRSDIICLQQSCPPPISGCNEEPISGFCCPRYECPVSMATVLNVTTSTTTTTTTLPPHFLSHAYKGHVQKRGCQIQGKPYNVGETVASASGPCMRCTCGGDGQMQCEPKACSPEPMLQQMIAVAAARRR